MRRLLLLLSLLAAPALAGERTPADPPPRGPSAGEIASASLGTQPALLAAPGLPERLTEGGRRPGLDPRRHPSPVARDLPLDRIQRPVLHDHLVRTGALRRLDFASSHALARAGVHAWRTAAPPPSGSV